MKLSDFINLGNLKNINKLWSGFWFMIVLVGAYAVLYSIIAGHHHAFNVTNKVPLGILLSTYVFFVVTSTGLCLVSSIGHVFGVDKMMIFAKRSIFMAIVCMLMGFATISVELEHPFRLFIWGVISPNPASPILWMGILYVFYLIFMSFEFVFLAIEKHKKARLFGLLGVISAVAAHSNLGAVFGYQLTRHFWHGPFMPVYFIMSAMLSGAGLILLIYIVPKLFKGETFTDDEVKSLDYVSKIFLFLLFVYLFFEVWKLLVGTYGHPPHEYEAIMAFLNGKYSLNFWIFEILLALVIPILILLTPNFKNLKGYLIAGLSNLIGIFVIRYDLVVGGQIVPLRMPEIPTTIYRFPEKYLYNPYTPSIYEILIVAGVIALTVLIYTVADYVLNFKSSNH